jgi:hypothetical protein
VDLYAYDVEMEALLRLWKNYRSLSVVAEQKKLSVFNATFGGYLDVFPRADYASLFSGTAGATPVPAAASSAQRT